MSIIDRIIDDLQQLLPDAQVGKNVHCGYFTEVSIDVTQTIPGSYKTVLLSVTDNGIDDHMVLDMRTMDRDETVLVPDTELSMEGIWGGDGFAYSNFVNGIVRLWRQGFAKASQMVAA